MSQKNRKRHKKVAPHIKFVNTVAHSYVEVTVAQIIFVISREEVDFVESVELDISVIPVAHS